MNLPCELVRDLLPLYEDGVCSDSSRSAVEEHLQTCESCRQLLGSSLSLAELEITPKNEEKAAAKSFRKIRRRWGASLLAVLVALPLLAVVVIMTVGQLRGQGVCFTNLDDIHAAVKFTRRVCVGRYREAAADLDHSMSYFSVQEALSLTPEDYLPNLVPVEIGGERWLATKNFRDAFLQNGEDDMQSWSYLVFCGVDLAMIPVEIWNEIARQNPMELTVDTDAYSLMNGTRFHLMQTQWGDYLVTENTWDSMESQIDEPFLWCYALELMPEAMYTDLLEDMKPYAREQWQSTQDWNAWARNLTLDEFSAVCNEQFVEKMTACRNMGITLDYRGIGNVYCIDGIWTVEVSVMARCAGQSSVITMMLSVRDDKIDSVSFSHREESTTWMDRLMEAFA